jgi:hypothetical protein
MAFIAGCTMRRAEHLASSLLTKSTQIPAESLLSAGHFSRTRQYIRFFSLLERAIGMLHNYPKSKKTKEAFVILSACGPIFDDLFDHKLATCDDIIRVTRSQQTIPGDDPLLAQYAVLLRNILERIVNKDVFLQTAEYLCQAQEAAGQQRNIENHNEVLHYTQLRGGYTALLCRCLVDIPLVDHEQELFMQLGYLSQITDDLFDWQEDVKNNHLTSVSASDSFDKVRETFESAHKDFLEIVNEIPLPQKCRKSFIDFLTIPLSSFYVALHHYYSLNAEISGAKGLNFPVCDMERKTNQLRMLWFATKVNESGIPKFKYRK